MENATKSQVSRNAYSLFLNHWLLLVLSNKILIHQQSLHCFKVTSKLDVNNTKQIDFFSS